MKYLRIYSDHAGESHFEEVDVVLSPVHFAPPAPPINLAPPMEAGRMILAHADERWFGDWHPTPARQFYIQLSGRLEFEVSDGETRSLEPGDMVLLEDTEGKGHTTRIQDEHDVTGVFVQLA